MRVCFALLFALYSVSIDGFRWRITIQSFTRSSSVRVLKEGADFEATLKKIIEAVDEGKIDQISQDLDGIRVSKLKELSPVQQLFDNLNDAEVRARVVDPDSFEEITLMMQLRQEMKRAQKSIQSSSSGGKETDMSQLLAELQADVVESNVPSLSLIDEIDRIDGLDEDEDSEEEEEEDVRDDIISPAIPLSLLSSTSPSSSSSSASQDVVYNGKGNDDDMATSSSSKREEFESLLRTAISSTTAAASSSSSSDSSAANREDEAEAMALRQSTVAAVESGNFAALDISSLLGDALNTLSNEMGLDIKSELAANPSQLQAIMQSSVAELAENMKELDLKSAELYEKLSNLEKELQMETEIYDEVKQMELSELLNDQNRLQQELSVSQQSMKENAFKLEEIMGKFEREADVLTALALFPLKSQDKKIAFIVGLALVFKIPYDMSMMFAVRGIEGNEIFSLLTQTLLAFTCFFHYGLIQAIGRKSTSVESTNLPPL